MKLNNALNAYLNNKISLWTLVEEVSFIDQQNDDNLKQSIKYIENNESDKGLIATVLLWCIKNSPLKDLSQTSNSFIKFLETIRSSDSNFFNQNIEWLYTENSTCTFTKDNLLFIINDDNSTRRMQLPDEYCNKKILCINCNEELETNYYIDVPNNTFYIIEVIE